MTLIKIILSIILAFYLFYRVGLLINKKLKTIHITDIVLSGAITLFAIFQVIGVAFIVFHVPFLWVYISTILIVATLLITSYILVGIKRPFKLLKSNIQKYKKMNIQYKMIKILVILLILGLAVFCSYLFKENADDGFYVSLITENIDSDEIYPNTEPSLGYGNDAQLSRYEISSYELFVSVFCKLTHISPAIMCHSVFPFIFILLSYCSYYLLIRTITKKSMFSLKWLLILTLIFAFEGTSRWTLGLTLFSKMWQGKAIFVNVVLPFVLTYLIRAYSKKKIKMEVVMLLIANTAGIFFTPIALFLITFSYIGFGVLLLLRKNFKKILHFLITGIPVLIFAILMLYLTKDGGTGAYRPVTIFTELEKFVGTGKFIYLYLVSAVVVLFIGNKKMKLVSTIIPFIYALTIYNPLFTELISKHLTGSAVFWRVLWLLPIEITISYCVITIFDKLKNKYLKYGFLVCSIVVIVLSGNICFRSEIGYRKPENFEKIPQAIIDQTNYILAQIKTDEMPVVMCPPEPLHSVTMRQLTAKIKMFWSRDFYMLDLFGHEEYNNMLKLYELYLNKEIKIEKEEFIHLLSKYKIDYMIVPNDYVKVIDYMEDIPVIDKTQVSGAYIYTMKKNM